VKDFISKKLLPAHKTEATPSNRAPEYVMALNSDSFEKITMDVDLDVMVIFFTTNGCKLCEEVWPLYIELAKLLHKTPNLRFISINMHLNELSDVHNIFYYPLLRFYPRDSKHRPYDYDQGLSLDEMKDFVKRVASVDLEW
jgi:thiol-disulfide isomerase/thioredoxin